MCFPLQLGSMGICMDPGGVKPVMESRNYNPKAPAISRYSRSILREYSKIIELPLHKIP